MNPQAHDASADDRSPNASLSALADGRADACDAALARWAADPEARATWHSYQLIGDVLRSEDLATEAGHDEAFLMALRSRLADEPTVIAPAPRAPSSVASRRWSVAAAAAGVLVVGGAVLSLRGGPSGDELSASAGAGRTAGLVPVAASGAMPLNGDPQWLVADGKVIRDARLDAYLWAHRGHSAVSGRFQTVGLER